MTRRDFDIWLHGFPRATREAPPQAISRVFGIPVPAAEALIATLPRVVKRDASADQAERLVHALEAIGGYAEAIPTKVVPAPVVVVGTQPAYRPETLVQHAPRSGVTREQAVLASTSTGGTLQLGTQELAALTAGAPWPMLELEEPALAEPNVALPSIPTSIQGTQDNPDRTLVDREPPRWADLELATPPPAAPRSHATPLHATPLPEPPTEAAARHIDPSLPEPRSHWEDIELQPPPGSDRPISLAPPGGHEHGRPPSSSSSELELTRNAHSWIEKVGQGPVPLTPLSSRPPPASDQSWITLTPHPVGVGAPQAWSNPMALPSLDPPPRSLGMRPPSERARSPRPRSLQPVSMFPGAPAQPDASFGEALAHLARGDLRGVVRASPTLAFALVLIGVTLLFAVAYAVL